MDTLNNKIATNANTPAATSAENVSAFRRSSLVQYSPPTSATTEPAASASSGIPTMATTPQQSRITASKAATILRERSSAKFVNTPVANGKKPANVNVLCGLKIPQEDILAQLVAKLGTEIDELIHYCDQRHNIHGEVKKRCSILKRCHTEITMELEAEQRRAKLNDTRHKPTLAAPETPQSAKRSRGKASPKDVTSESGRTPEAKKRKASTPGNLQHQKSTTPRKEQEWTKVQDKKDKEARNHKRVAKAIRPRADALVIAKKADGVTYADILREVKSNDDLKDLSVDVRTMRPTQKGGLLIELKRKKDANTAKYQAIIEKALANLATVDLRTHMVTVQCRDLITDVSTTDELIDAMTEQAKIRRPEICSIKSIRTTYRGIYSAYVSLTAEDAKRVLSLGHLRVGWIRCRVSEVIVPKHCFRCWGYGHMATTCKEPDRANQCRRCGGTGHKSASCKQEEKCALCAGAHAAGSAKCPRYQDAARRRT